MNAELPRPGPRYRPLLQLLRTAESIWNVSRQFFARWDLSPSQFNILNLLRSSQDGLTQVELSRELIMHRSNLTGMVDRLEERGYVSRKASPDDRRAWRVVLTRKGRELVESILPQYYAMAEKVWGGVPREKVEQLSNELASLSDRAQDLARELS